MHSQRTFHTDHNCRCKSFEYVSYNSFISAEHNIVVYYAQCGRILKAYSNAVAVLVVVVNSRVLGQVCALMLLKRGSEQGARDPIFKDQFSALGKVGKCPVIRRVRLAASLLAKPSAAVYTLSAPNTKHSGQLMHCTMGNLRGFVTPCHLSSQLHLNRIIQPPTNTDFIMCS